MKDYPDEFDDRYDEFDIEREPRLEDKTLEEWERLFDRGLEVPEEVVEAIVEKRKHKKDPEEYRKEPNPDLISELFGSRDYLHDPEEPKEPRPTRPRFQKRKKKAERRIQTIDDIVNHHQILGLAFEYTAGLFLQLDRPRLIIPQARLNMETTDEFKNAYIDFYAYDDCNKDGEIIEVKWGRDFRNIVETVKKLFYASRSYLNQRKDSGSNINIDTERDRMIELIVHIKNPSYSNDSVIYNSLEELTSQDPYFWPIRAIDGEIELLHRSGNRWGLKDLMKATFGMFMSGFETGAFYDIEKYAAENLKMKNYLPKDLADYVAGKVIPRTVHANGRFLPRKSTIAAVSECDPDSVVVYPERRR